jgi:hypothetical protein
VGTEKQLAAIERAQEARLQQAAEKALRDPIRLRMAARIFRAARQRGLVDPDGRVIEQGRGNGSAEAPDLAAS